MNKERIKTIRDKIKEHLKEIDVYEVGSAISENAKLVSSWKEGKRSVRKFHIEKLFDCLGIEDEELENLINEQEIEYKNFYNETYKNYVGYVRHIINQTSLPPRYHIDKDDIEQETWIHIYTYIDAFNDKYALATWLALGTKTVRNKVIRQYTKRIECEFCKKTFTILNASNESQYCTYCKEKQTIIHGNLDERINPFTTYSLDYEYSDEDGGSNTLVDILCIEDTISLDEEYKKILCDFMKTESSEEAMEHASMLIDKAMNVLSDRYKKIIFERYFNGKTLQEVADIFDISRERIRQLEEKAINQMRNELNVK